MGRRTTHRKEEDTLSKVKSTIKNATLVLENAQHTKRRKANQKRKVHYRKQDALFLKMFFPVSPIQREEEMTK